jgi:DNA replication and repair protein RecF
VRLEYLQIKNFRCFTEFDVELDAPIVLISGANGSGKTSILEALHYACYLRSFRTHLPRELLYFNQDTLSIKLGVRGSDALCNDIAVGYSGKKKLIKINQQPVESYKQLTDYYRVVTLTEDDILLIKGSPEQRRSYLDQALALYDSTIVHHLKQYKQILHNRNALLFSSVLDQDMYSLWTERLWQATAHTVRHRITFLARIEQRVNELLGSYFSQDFAITLTYQEHYPYLDKPSVLDEQLKRQEYAFKRSLFGAHLDDFSISFNSKKTKSYASRGQQKLTILLLKIAQLQEITTIKGSALFLLDDFMNDFDHATATTLLAILKTLPGQLIFTSPLQGGFIQESLVSQGAKLICLTD